MPTYEGLRLKVLKYWRVGLAGWRKSNSSLLTLQLSPITAGAV